MLAVVILSLALAVVDRTAADRLYERGQFREAAGEYRKLADANPTDASLWIRFGNCSHEIGQFHDAEAAFRRALDAAPDSPAALVGVAEALLAQGRGAEARQPIFAAMRLKPGDRDARRAYAHILVTLHEFFQAESILKELTGADPQDAKSWFLLGELSYRGGYYRAAEESLAKSLAIQPANRRAEIYRAVCLIKTGRLDEGELQSKRLMDPSTPKDLDLWLTYVELLYDSNRTTEALQTANQVIGFAPGDPIARYWLAKALLQAGNLAEASREAERAVATAPQLPFARVLLLQVYRRQGRSADAERQADWLRDYDDRRARHDAR